MPLVHHDGVEIGEDLGGGFEREQNRERLGRSHQRRRPVGSQPPSVGGRAVAGAEIDPPAAGQAAQPAEWFRKGGSGVSREGAEWRHPDHAEAARGGRLRVECEPSHRGQPGREGLARARGGMHEPAGPGSRSPPDFFLEGKDIPAAIAEPGSQQIDNLIDVRRPNRWPSTRSDGERLTGASGGVHALSLPRPHHHQFDADGMAGE